MRNYAPDYERLMGRIKEGSERTLRGWGKLNSDRSSKNS